MSIEQEKMIVEALPSLYPLQEFEEKAIQTILDALPPAQPEIIRCKDCKHFESEYGYCDYYQWNMTGGDFCSKAERREVTE